MGLMLSIPYTFISNIKLKSPGLKYNIKKMPKFNLKKPSFKKDKSFDYYNI